MPLPTVLTLSLALWASPADAASITLTDANGNVYVFDDVPCCADWSLAAGTSCVDDCVLASTGGGPPLPAAVAQAARLGAEDGLTGGDLDAMHALLASRLGVETMDAWSVYLRTGAIIDRVDDRGRQGTSPEALLCTDALMAFTLCADAASSCAVLEARGLPDGVTCAAPPEDRRPGRGR